jgi:hypothetical protein
MSDTIALFIPEDWNSLSLPQLRQLCRLIAKAVPHDYRRQILFCHWSGIRMLPHNELDANGMKRFLFFHLKLKKRFFLSLPDFVSFLHRLDFTHDEPSLTIQLMPSLRASWRRLYGPSSSLFNISYGEFIHAEACYNRYISSNDVNDLNSLCAVLYRPSNGVRPRSIHFEGDRREIFNDFIYPDRGRWLRRVPRWRRIAIFLFYSGCRQALFQAHPMMNRRVESDQLLDVNEIDLHRRMINTLNKGDITKNKRVLDSLAWDVFAMLDSMIENVQKMQEK